MHDLNQTTNHEQLLLFGNYLLLKTSPGLKEVHHLLMSSRFFKADYTFSEVHHTTFMNMPVDYLIVIT